MGSRFRHGVNPHECSLDDIETAAGWMARLLADDATDQDRSECRRWREADPRHERAWQKMTEVSGKFASVPANTDGARVLMRARQTSASRRRFLNLSLLMAVGATAGWLGATHTGVGHGMLAEYRTGVGESETVTLEDGTRLTLNTDTAVDVSFSPTERRIRLHHGEIRLDTGQETPRRRFIVQTRFGELVALGTTFVVREHTSHVRLAVTAGAVEIHPPLGAPRRVDAGQQAQFDADRAESPVRLDPASVSWETGKLVAEGMTVAEFTEEIGRYRPGFTLHDAAIGDLTISGVFSLQDTDRALRALADSLPVRLEYRTAYWVKVKSSG
ncbi:MAG: FecR domain-containing protein [Guyparkeria sp.]|uniref:FecR domain-containing protein n=1 Tax=Guyparkeria sp. TaxID=2035736 RepID=UPI00397B1546